MGSENFDLSSIKLAFAPVSIKTENSKWFAFLEKFDQVGLQAVVDRKLCNSASSFYQNNRKLFSDKRFKFGSAGGVFTIQRIK